VGTLDLEFHQLVIRYEHLRARHPERQRRLLASLAASGQQLPIVVVPMPDDPARYLVIDGHQRIAALRRLGRDTVRASIWQMTEAEALLLDRSLRTGEAETAIEQGWLLAELGQRFDYGLEELARRFDRSVSWVSRRLALVELLPEAVQQQVRSGQIRAHVAMKFLVPVARLSLEDCGRMAAAFATHACNTREAGRLYAAWREGSSRIRQRILDDPKLFLKASRPVDQEPSDGGAAADFLKNLTVVCALTSRLARGFRQVAGLLDETAVQTVHRRLDQALDDLGRLAQRIDQEENDSHVKLESTDHDSRTVPPGSDQTGDCTNPGSIPTFGQEGYPIRFARGAAVAACRESPSLARQDSGAALHLPRQPGPGP
jgi:ParB family transcriptional regulator, chromosome partitioning protein